MAAPARTRTRKRSTGHRVLFVLATVLVVLALAWTAGWFVLAGRIERSFDEATARLAREGRADVACGERGVEGFPFALRFACEDGVEVASPGGDGQLERFVAGWSVLDPSRARVTATGPLLLAPGEGTADTLTADWTSAVAEATDLFDRRGFRLDVDGATLEGAFGRVSAAAVDGALGAEPTAGAEDDLRVSGALRDVALRPLAGRLAGETVPLAAASLDATLVGLHARLVEEGRPFDRRQGLAGRLHALRIDVGGSGGGGGGGDGALAVSGPFTVSPDGFLSGTFTFAVRDPDAVGRWVESVAGPDPRVRGALAAFAALGRPQEVDGETMQAVTLEAVNGKVPFGLFSFDLPRVWRPPASAPDAPNGAET